MRQSEFQKRLIESVKEHPRRPTSIAYLLARQSWRKFRTRYIDLDRILCGSEHGLSGIQLSRHSGDITRTSKRVRESAHTKFLEEYKKIGDRVFGCEIFAKTEYFANAASCIRLFGDYFTATREEEIIRIAENFVRKYNGTPIVKHKPHSVRGFSDMSQPVRVFPIKYSNCFQVGDGNHRLAIACARGEAKVPVRIMNRPQVTCLQELLLEVSWNPNKFDLYQPIESPEVQASWQLVRHCSDRFGMMRNFLEARELGAPNGQTYLDVACNYGWFVKSMQDLGYQTLGLEIDWAARQIGEHFYGLKQDQLIGSEVIRFFSSNSVQYDVVSCFSLMHHFVMGKGDVSPEALLNFLERSTRRVLFFDMGEEHEAMLGNKLKGWNPDSIEKWLRDNANFREVLPLGTDEDQIPPYQRDYGRTLFACVK